MTTVKRMPEFDLKFVTEKNDYLIRYDARNPSSDTLAEKVISVTTKNAMSDDSAVFSIVVAGDTEWDKILDSNDVVILKIYPNLRVMMPDNVVVLVGLISEVRREGDYSNNSIIYRITGQSFAKSFMQFQLGVIQEVSVVITDIGWLPDSKADGVEFTGKTAAEIGKSITDRFKKYMKYNFNREYTMENFLDYSFSSWKDYEKLADPTPFINYEGSLKQLLDDVTAKPFNELFFESTSDEKCKMIMRRTPFNKEDWDKLPSYKISTEAVISDSLAKGDTEAYSIFNVTSGNMAGATSVDLNSFPQYHQALVDKYGYKKLEVDNRYLFESSTDGSSTTEKADVGSKEKTKTVITYSKFNSFMRSYTSDQVRMNQSSIAKSLVDSYDKLTTSQANQLLAKYSAVGAISEADFKKIVGDIAEGDNTGTATLDFDSVNSWFSLNYSSLSEVSTNRDATIKAFVKNFANTDEDQATKIVALYISSQGVMTKEKFDAIIKESTSSSTKDPDNTTGNSSSALQYFSKTIYNWYSENANFYAGDIKVIGSPVYRLGSKLLVEDKQQGDEWEFYIESVSHEYSYTAGYTTTLGVTRGLNNKGKDRFTHLWGKSSDFKGGLLGEKTSAELIQEAGSTSSGSDGSGDVSTPDVQGSDVAVAALRYGLAHKKPEKKSVYSFGGGRGSSNPMEGKEPYAMDCSSFVWWCYKACGVTLAGAQTQAILGDDRFNTVSSRGSKSKEIFKKMQVGDLVYFYDNNTHIGMYAGEGKFLGCNGDGSWDTNGGVQLKPMDSGYWWTQFQGHVIRFV
ncbi:secretory antigen SsaA-like protein [Listeria phage List-36]|uniref:Secretory antigen SsaA-like protein n=4 Tax=Pecentumvirus TaxID=1857844 RepID=A0A5C2IHG1_9CAUD|nr:tail protein with lysin activity [Listeria phage vB_LmoM_AG20]YP_009042905.1 tail protein with lysin activity [Listeria phage LP-048]YP_009043454.1 tail protein with lysin activity [Listeria phage List-36]QEP53095.2 secretory antigen SsaA-like protein [Listeria phage LP-039]WIW77328.1 putative tail lysin [Listeria phage cka15]AFJ76026.1 putative tail lysin [Listeria phage vB_LmoM_AG20]AHL19770.1 putative tail lysin [Listeria phage LP-048]AIA64247.1 secretory antigen SsaA-like protein [Lis